MNAILEKGWKLSMLLLLFIILKSNSIYSQSLNNINFEDGTTNGWIFTTGVSTNATTMGGCCPQVNYDAGAVKIISTGQNDPNIPVLRAYPTNGGKYNLQLGVSDVNALQNKNAYRATKEFTVDGTKPLLMIDYAAVLGGSSPHTCEEQPYFNIRVKTCTGGVLIPCGGRKVVVPQDDGTTCGESNVSDFTNYNMPKPAGGNFVESQYFLSYTQWQRVTFDLRDYVGQCISLELTVASCTRGGHRGYVYFDADCVPFQLGVDSSEINLPLNHMVIDTLIRPCSGDPNVTLKAQDGFSKYEWTAPAGSGITNFNTQSISTPTPGTYTVLMTPFSFTGAVSCKSTLVTINLQLGEPRPSPTASYSGPTSVCEGQSVTFTNTSTANGTATFSTSGYDWNIATTEYVTKDVTRTFPTAGTYPVKLKVINSELCEAETEGSVIVKPTPTVQQVADVKGCTNDLTNPSATGSNLIWYNSGGISLGTPLPSVNTPIASSTDFYVTQTVNGCESPKAKSTVTINARPDITISAKLDAHCFGSSDGYIKLNVVNGLAPYQYLWSNTATTKDILNIPAGNYLVTVTDANLCTSTASTVIKQPPTSFAISSSNTNVACNGESNGAIILNITGPSSYNYSYSWSNNAVQKDISNLPAGTYSVTVQENTEGCSLLYTTVITQPNVLTVTPVTTNVICLNDGNGAINLNVAGGTTPYTYLWSNGATISNISNLVAGRYDVTVTDNNNCKATSFAVLPNGYQEPVPVIKDITLCSAAEKFTPVARGNFLQWYDANQTLLPTTPLIDKSQIGDVVLYVQSISAQGCKSDLKKFTATIKQSPSLELVSKNDPNCRGFNKGDFEVRGLSGCDNNYTYQIKYSSRIQQSGLFTKIDPGQYTVIVNTACGCTGELPVSIVTLMADCELLMPNGFTPNGDNNNDIFRPAQYNSITSYNMKVYNRWGQLLYESSNPAEGWDGTYNGTKQPSDTYVWQITYSNSQNNRIQKKGTFALIR